MPRVVPSQVVKLIDHFFPTAQAEELGGITDNVTLDTAKVGQLDTIIELVKQIPDSLITVPEHEYGLLMCSLSTVRAAIGEWNARNATANKSLTPVPVLPRVEGQSPIALIRRALRQCNDEAPSHGTPELPFIEDSEFRKLLRTDIGAVEVALANSEWKSATVLAGSIIEALLLWALEKRKPEALAAENTPKGREKTSELERWDLHDFIEVALELDTITKETAQQARLAKDFRNLIHPGRSARLRKLCDRGTALSAVAAVEHVVRDLSYGKSRAVAQ